MNTLKFWAVFTVGVAAGAAVALIYAPQPGAKTRKQLKRSFNDASDYLKDASEKHRRLCRQGREARQRHLGRRLRRSQQSREQSRENCF